MTKKILTGILIILAIVLVFGGINKKTATRKAEAPKTNNAQTENPQDAKRIRESKKYVILGFKKYLAKDYKGSLADCNKAVELDSKNVRAYNCRARAKMRLRDKEGVMQDMETVLSIDPNNKEALSRKKFLQKNK